MRITETDLAELKQRKESRPAVARVVDNARILVRYLHVWVPGRLRNPLNGSQGTTRGGRIMRSRWRREWRARTRLCIHDAATRAGIVLGMTDHGPWHPRSGKVLVLTAYVWNLYDDDGLRAVLKPILDGCRDAGVIHDDGPAAIPTIHRVETCQAIDRAHRGVAIVIEPRRE